MFQYDYFNESLQFGKDLVGWMVIKVANPDDSDKIASRIDAHVRELVERDQDRHRTRVHQAVPRPGGQHRPDPGVGDHRGVLHHAAGHGEHHGAIGPRAHQRDRRAEDSRVQRRVHSQRSCCSSRCSSRSREDWSGLGLAWFFAKGLGAAIKDYFPVFEIGTNTFLVGAALMLVFGVITGLWPALTAMRLKIVDALRRI